MNLRDSIQASLIFYAQPLLSHRYCNTIYHELTVRLERASGILIVWPFSVASGRRLRDQTWKMICSAQMIGLLNNFEIR